MLISNQGQTTDTGDVINIGGNRDKPQRPVQPPKFKKDQVERDVRETLLKYRRNPGIYLISVFM